MSPLTPAQRVDAAQALQSMRDTYEAPTARAEGAVFPSVMAAFFAVLALGSLAAAFLAVGGSRPRMATVATMSLWCLVAVLMFLGAGGSFKL
jgi:fatty acid desaturase